MDGLDLATTDELVNELKKRFSAFVCVGIYERPECADVGTEEVWKHWHGSGYTCYGLLRLVTDQVFKEGVKL
jgi:hypothetical protein